MGREGGDPCPNFWHIGVKKKVVQVVQIRGGLRANLDKIQKNSYFFRESVPYSKYKNITNVSSSKSIIQEAKQQKTNKQDVKNTGKQKTNKE